MRFRLRWPWQFELVVRSETKPNGAKEELKVTDPWPWRVREQARQYAEAARQVGL